MPASLLEHQFATLEVPGEDEAAISVAIAASEAEVVTSLLKAIGETT